MSSYWEFKADFASLDEEKIEAILDWLVAHDCIGADGKEVTFLFGKKKKTYKLSSVSMSSFRGNEHSYRHNVTEVNVRELGDWQVSIGLVFPLSDSKENIGILRESYVWAEPGTEQYTQQENEFNQWIKQLRLHKKSGKIGFGLFYCTFYKNNTYYGDAICIRPAASDLSTLLYASKEFHELLGDFSHTIGLRSAGIHFEGDEMGYTTVFVSQTKPICAYDTRLRIIPAIKVCSGAMRGPCFYPFMDNWGKVIADVMEKHLGWKHEANRLRELLRLESNETEFVLSADETKELQELLSWEGKTMQNHHRKVYDLLIKKQPITKTADDLVSSFENSESHVDKLKKLEKMLPKDEYRIIANIREIAAFIDAVQEQGFVIKIVAKK